MLNLVLNLMHNWITKCIKILLFSLFKQLIFVLDAECFSKIIMKNNSNYAQKPTLIVDFSSKVLI